MAAQREAVSTSWLAEMAENPNTDGDTASAAGWVVLLVVLSVLGLAVVLGVFFVTRSNRLVFQAMHTDVLVNLETIQRAQRSHHARFGTFVACEDAAPKPLAQVGRAYRPWTGGACWDELGWEPEGPSVRGTYWVEVQADTLTVHGAIDADGDGVPALFRATTSSPPSRTTPDGVY